MQHDLLGQARATGLPFEEAELSPMARSFYADSKRVSNAEGQRLNSAIASASQTTAMALRALLPTVDSIAHAIRPFGQLQHRLLNDA